MGGDGRLVGRVRHTLWSMMSFGLMPHSAIRRLQRRFRDLQFAMPEWSCLVIYADLTAATGYNGRGVHTKTYRDITMMCDISHGRIVQGVMLYSLVISRWTRSVLGFGLFGRAISCPCLIFWVGGLAVGSVSFFSWCIILLSSVLTHITMFPLLIRHTYRSINRIFL